MITCLPLPHAVKWFKVHHERVYDWLKIPNDEENGELLRHEITWRLNVRLTLQRIPNDGRIMELGLFIRQMREVMDDLGGYAEPGKIPDPTDLYSSQSLGRIWKMCIEQAQGYHHWKMAMDKDILQASPAMELVQLEKQSEPCDWPTVWEQHGGKFYGIPRLDYPQAPGHMIALNTDEIWLSINRFGVPWKPFVWDSGMGTINVRRKEALELGLLSKNQAQSPITGWWDLEE